MSGHVIITIMSIPIYLYSGYKYWSIKNLNPQDPQLSQWRKIYYGAFITFFFGNLVWALIK